MNGLSLLLDAGNTRLKWALIECNGDHANWLESGAADYDHLDPLPALWRSAGTLVQCHGVTVADMTKNLAIHNLLSNLALQPHWLRPAASGGGVRNLYKPPGSLGADRWAALVGARQRTLDACLVVSAGTALTIDALRADGSFPGGAIIPGMQAMRRSLALATAHVGERYGQPNAFPDNTADAVESGLLLAMSGAIQQMHGRLAALESAAPVCLLHGGDADALIEILPFATQHAPNLILEGVCALARGTH